MELSWAKFLGVLLLPAPVPARLKEGVPPTSMPRSISSSADHGLAMTAPNPSAEPSAVSEASE